MGGRLSKASILDHGTSGKVLLGGALAGVGILAAFACGALSKRQGKSYELGNVDLLQMTRSAAKSLHRRPAKTTSMIPDVLQDLEETNGITAPDSFAPAAEVDRSIKALEAVGAPPFRQYLKQQDAGTLERGVCKVLQLNIGLYCNQACTHCHVESSPLRTEMAPEAVIDRLLYLLRNSPQVECLDITGGAPEMNRGFRRLVEGAAAMRDDGTRPGLRIMDRCNLTVLLEPGYEDLPDFFVKNKVELICSLPSYDASQTDKQRGRQVFERSMEALKILNSYGYGSPGGHCLNLVFNPPGPFLPPRQDALEAKYKQELASEHGVEFNNLFTLANMPVKRFFDHLRKTKMLEGYMDLLVRNFNKDTVPFLMCRETVNVKYDGQIFDCDFNQQLDLGVGKNLTVFDIDSLHDEKLQKAPIATRAHCYGCTAAQGSG